MIRIYFIFLLCFSGMVRLSAQQASLATYFNSIVAIQKSTNEKGMGFIVSRFPRTASSGYYYVATAKHVVGESVIVPVYFDNLTKPATGTVVQTSIEHDVALLKVPSSSFDWTPVPYLIDVRIKDPLWFAIKTTSVRKILPVEGAEDFELTAVSSNQLTAQLTGVNRGCSGGPLIGKKGIVGMITHLLSNGQTLAVPIKIVRNLVKNEWDEAWDLPLGERDEIKTAFVYGPEQEVKIVAAHATNSGVNRRLMIDDDTTTYWYSNTSPSNQVKRSFIDLFLEKPTKVTAIAVFIPKKNYYKYFDLITPSFGQEYTKAGFGMYERASQYETKKTQFVPIKEEPAGTWYGSRFTQPTHITRTVSFTIDIEGGDNERQYGQVNEIKIWGEPIDVRTIQNNDQIEQIPLTNTSVTRVNGDPYQGQYLTDGNKENAIYINLNDAQRPNQQAVIEIELPETHTISHLRIYNNNTNAYGSIRSLQPYYDDVAGKEIFLEGLQGWEQVALPPQIQARSLKFVIKEGWDTYGDQKTIQLSEIQLLGLSLLKMHVPIKNPLKSVPIAGVYASINSQSAYQMINDITYDGWYGVADKKKSIQFDLFTVSPVLIEGISIYNKPEDLIPNQLQITFNNGVSQYLKLRGVPGWEEIMLQTPGRTDIVHFNMKGINAVGNFRIHEIQLLSRETASIPRSGSIKKAITVMSSSQYDDYYSSVKAVDADVNTAWSPAVANTYEPWLRFDFGKQVDISQIEFTNQPDNNAVTGIRLEFSDGAKSEHYTLKGFNKLPELVNLIRTHRVRWVKVIFEKWLPNEGQMVFKLNELTFYGN